MNNDFNLQTKEEKKEVYLDTLNYKNEKISYSLVLLGLVFNVLYFIALYNNDGQFYYTYNMGLSVIYNLLFMLFVFLSAENIKVYNKKYSYALLAIGIMQIVRIFNYPLDALNNGQLTSNQYTWICICLSLSALLLILGAVIGFIRSTMLENYRKSKGE